MLSSVLRSSRAVRVNIAIMRAFVLLRQTFSSHAEITKKLDILERKSHEHDVQIEHVPAAYAMALLHQIAALEGTLHCYHRSLGPGQPGIRKEDFTENHRTI